MSLSSRTITTLSIGDSALRLLTSRGDQVLSWGSVPIPSGLVKDGLILNASALAPALAQLFQSRSIPKERVIASLAGLHTSSRIISLPRLGKALRQEAIYREVKRVSPRPLEELSLFYQTISSRNGDERFFVLGIARDLLQAQLSALKQLGLTPHLMEPKAVALARVVSRPQALILDLEPEGLEIVLAIDGIPVITRRTSWGGEAKSPEDRAQVLGAELSRIGKFYATAYPETPLEPGLPAFLAGELTAEEALVALCHQHTPYPIEAFTPPLKYPPELPLAQFAVNLGLALKTLSPARGQAPFPLVGLKMELEPARRRSYPLKRLLRPVAIAAAASLLVPIYMLHSQMADQGAQLRAELAQANRELRLGRIERQKVQELTQPLEESRAAAKGLEAANLTISSQKAALHATLQEVFRVLEPGTRLTSLSATRSQVALQGRAEEFASVSQYARALEGTGKFSRVSITSLTKTPGKGGEISFVIVAVRS